MPYSPTDRATFVTLLAHLGPDGNVDELISFVRDRWRESLEELAARPGWDHIRAGLVRIVPDLVGEVERAELLGAARAAVLAYPEDLAHSDPSLLIARHPAWVGLCALELAAAMGESWPTALDRSVSLAHAGFSAMGSPDGPPAGRGEILWAMAEQADESGWADRARELLRAALASPFEDAASRARVRLLLGLGLVEDGDDGGIELLEVLAEDPVAEERARVHALWVLAAVARERGRIPEAREALHRAASLVDAGEESDVAHRIQAAIDVLDDRD